MILVGADDNLSGFISRRSLGCLLFMLVDVVVSLCHWG